MRAITLLTTIAVTALQVRGTLAQSVNASHPVPIAVGDLQLINVRADTAVYRGRGAIRIVRDDGLTAPATRHSLALLPSLHFSEGVIDVEIAGIPLAGADTSLRGFVGIAFHVDPQAGHFRAFYLRPTNGRALDQLRRNHSTQYIAEPDYPWHRLRREEPGVYESYVDLKPGEWTSVRIIVRRNQALLYVHQFDQPVLVVNDLKTGPTEGQVGLWIGLGTEAHFSSIRIGAMSGDSNP